jgi:hypothetical protein
VPGSAGNVGPARPDLVVAFEMSYSPEQPERRRRNLYDTGLWERDLNGYAVCPWCAAMIYSERADFHQEKCAAAPPDRRSELEAEELVE